LEPIQLKPISNCPWLDDDLKYLAAMRDRAYKDFKISRLDSDKDWFKKLKVDFEKLNNLKMIEFFDKKKINDFSNSKLFWQFHYSYIKIKSDKSYNQTISSITSDSNIITNQKLIRQSNHNAQIKQSYESENLKALQYVANKYPVQTRSQREISDFLKMFSKINKIFFIIS
jgi:predicted DNA binding CopG/RHH family protein